MSKHFLIISGIPGTGKSTYSEWLCSTHGFAHQDIDKNTTIAPEFLQSERIVIDWGFPANEASGLTGSLATIESWKSKGAELWWFDGDRRAALKKYLALGKPRKLWDYQVSGIRDNWKRINLIIESGKRLDVISASAHMTNEEMYKIMFPRGLEALLDVARDNMQAEKDRDGGRWSYQ
jgi:hypothetical protein